MKSVRIVERTKVNGNIEYVIQQKHWLLFWLWVDASSNTICWCEDSFKSFDDAVNNLCYFNGSKERDKVKVTIEL